MVRKERTQYESEDRMVLTVWRYGEGRLLCFCICDAATTSRASPGETVCVHLSPDRRDARSFHGQGLGSRSRLHQDNPSFHGEIEADVAARSTEAMPHPAQGTLEVSRYKGTKR